MNLRLTAALSLALLTACQREQAVKAPAGPAPGLASTGKSLPAVPPVRVNLLDAGRGGTVISRTGEHSLEVSPVLTIDGDRLTLWSTPRDNAEQTIVFALPARSLVDEIAVQVGSTEDQYAPRKLALESSLDGVTFTPLITFTPGLVEPMQTRSITPVEMRYLRVKTVGASRFSQVREFAAHGRELEPPAPGRLEGAWMLNSSPAHFVTRGARTFGVLADREPLYVDGGSDGRAYRFAWSRGPQIGLALVTVSPDGKHLSGIQWHTEKVSFENVGRTWFGDRADSNDLKTDGTEVMLAFMRHTGFYPLYGLYFDEGDGLIESESDATLAMVQALVTGSAQRRFRLTAVEVRGDAAGNHARATKRIGALREVLQRRRLDLSRVSFAIAGAEQARVKADTPVEHALYGVVELQLEPPQAAPRLVLARCCFRP